MGIEQRSNAGARLVPRAGPAGAATMRAAVQHRYGPPSVLELSEVGLPLPGRGDVLVQVGTARVLPGFTRQQLKPFLSVEKRQDLLTLADRTNEHDPTRAYAHPDLPPLQRSDRSTRKKNR